MKKENRGEFAIKTPNERYFGRWWHARFVANARKGEINSAVLAFVQWESLTGEGQDMAAVNWMWAGMWNPQTKGRPISEKQRLRAFSDMASPMPPPGRYSMRADAKYSTNPEFLPVRTVKMKGMPLLQFSAVVTASDFETFKNPHTDLFRVDPDVAAILFDNMLSTQENYIRDSVRSGHAGIRIFDGDPPKSQNDYVACVRVSAHTRKDVVSWLGDDEMGYVFLVEV